MTKHENMVGDTGIRAQVCGQPVQYANHYTTTTLP